MSSDRQASIQHENAAVCPGCEKTALVRWSNEGRIVILEGDVHISKRRRGWSRSTNGKGEAMGLVYVVVGVLAKNDDLDLAERSVV
jgi:hypothetical protein